MGTQRSGADRKPAREPSGQVFRRPPDGVVDETIDGEVIIIQLDQGNYFSLTGSGSEIWAGLTHGAAVDELAESLGERYDRDPPGFWA